MNTGLETSFVKAKNAEKRGDRVEAEQIYRAILDRFPANARALKAIEMLRATPPTGDPPKAVLTALGLLYRKGLLDRVVAEGEALLPRHPRSATLLNILGGAHAGLKRFETAEPLFRASLALAPDRADTLFNLAVVLKQRGDTDGAIALYRRLVAVKPDHGQAYANLARALSESGHLDEAASAYRQASAILPASFDCHANLGSVLKLLGRNEDAVDAFRQAIAIKPDHAEAHLHLGHALRNGGRLAEAAEAYRRAVSLGPDNPEALNNLGHACRDLRRLDLAVTAYERGLALRPDDAVLAQKLHQQAHMCDWTGVEQFRRVAARIGVEGDPVSPFALLACEDDPERQLARSERWTAQAFALVPQPLPAAAKRPDDPLRIGYFSADFHEHATMHLMSGLFREHDRQRFEILVYSYGGNSGGSLRERLAADASRFIDVHGMADAGIIDRARQDALDIAVDLKGYTTQTRSGLFAHRLAPVQISYVGYPGSMGADFIDYLIADPVVIPMTERRHYREHIIYLPDSYQPNDDRRAIAAQVASRADLGLPEHGFVFCCFNNSYKIGPEEFDIWMRLLHRIDGSVLWLLQTNRWATANLRREAEKRGIDPDRLVFAKPLPHAEHLARLDRADLFLDTFNYNAHTTASDALWAGLPLVTRAGRQFAARVAASLLGAVGLPELVTGTSEAYEALILDLAGRAERLSAIRTKLAANRLTAPLFDTVRYTRHVEAAYEAVHIRQREGRPPADIRIG